MQHRTPLNCGFILSVNSGHPYFTRLPKEIKKKRKSLGDVHTAHKNGTMVTNSCSAQALTMSTAQGRAFPCMDLVSAPSNRPCRQDLTDEVTGSARSSGLFHIRSQNGHSSDMCSPLQCLLWRRAPGCFSGLRHSLPLTAFPCTVTETSTHGWLLNHAASTWDPHLRHMDQHCEGRC